MEQNDSKAVAQQFEDKVRRDLTEFLQKREALDKHVPECPDVEEKWGEIARAYMPDGAREFKDYPVVSLGWMMLIGMAMAYYWDTDWTKHSARKDYYELLRDMRGYDNMDEAVVEDVLGYRDEAAEKITALVAECASRVFSLLNHEHVEPGTEAALGCYIAALHQLYLAGMAMELNALGYHMTALQG
ncbi:MAG: hypothetical protein K2M72_02895 [Paramuribaculum sp.]|nr:hypothetical protein [Bacteroidales bacterium]MDE7449143.1 hypothetical protein [Paramuribaculum sp.]